MKIIFNVMVAFVFIMCFLKVEGCLVFNKLPKQSIASFYYFRYFNTNLEYYDNAVGS